MFVISDLNFHDGDGFDVLRFMRWRWELCPFPRVIFLSSNPDIDFQTALPLAANEYSLKGVEMHARNACVRSSTVGALPQRVYLGRTLRGTRD